jgi:hypothetical protein
LLSSLGEITLKRHWWGNRCPCALAGYVVDQLLGVESRLTRRVQKRICCLAADVSFEKAREHLVESWPVSLSAESIRAACHEHGEKMRQWQSKDEHTPIEFAQAKGEVEFTVDAGKVNTREFGWKDLKIAVFQKRPLGAEAAPAEWATRKLPRPTACVAWAGLQKIDRFRTTWRKWSRRVGVKQAGEIHALGDGASWIWKAVSRVFTGCQQTLDIYHGCHHVAKAGERLYEQGSKDAAAFLERGRTLLLERGWHGITTLMGEELVKEDTPKRRACLEKMLGYFLKHISRLGYPDRLKAGQAIGSGAVEGWAKTLGLRLKARGARWRKKNVKKMASLGCVRNSSQWEVYWSMAA